MPKQFENPIEKKVDEDLDPKESAEKRIDNLAEKAAEKGTKTEQNYEKDQSIFSH